MLAREYYSATNVNNFQCANNVDEKTRKLEWKTPTINLGAKSFKRRQAPSTAPEVEKTDLLSAR